MSHSSHAPATGWAPFLWVAAALGIGVMGTALASPLYPLYQRAWHIPASTVTLIFVAYMLGVLAAFLFLGRLPGYLGAVGQLRAALLLILAGLGLSMLADGVGMLLAGRLCIGVASGLITTAATLGLLELEPPGPRRRASLIASVTSMTGFGLGPLLGGALAQWVAWPLVTPYLAMIAALAVVLAGLMSFRAPRPMGQPRRPGALSLRPRFVLPPRAARPRFLVGAFATFCAFALFSLFASLAPSFVADLLPWRGPAVSGAAIAVILFCSAGSQMALRGLPPRGCLLLGLGALGVAVLLLAGALATGSAALFVASDLVAGMGHGLSFMAGLTITNAVAPPEERAGVLSCFFSIGYLGTIVPVLGVGVLADHLGLIAAVLVFCAAFGVAVLGLLAATPRAVPATV